MTRTYAKSGLKSIGALGFDSDFVPLSSDKGITVTDMTIGRKQWMV
jgi:hypothetical protein